MNIIFFGDIVGSSGRKILKKHLPQLKKNFNCDFVIANGENSASGFGITDNVYNELLKYGIDVITGGNHTWDKPDTTLNIDKWDKFIRPANYHPSAKGVGYRLFNTPKKDVLVISLLGRVFMDICDDPFRAFDSIYEKYAGSVIIVDFHGEATSEKNAFGLYVDGRATLVVGTHTHVQTNDFRILQNGTAYITDVGMCGSLDSVIGMNKDMALNRFISSGKRKIDIEKNGRMMLNGIHIEIDENNKILSYNLIKVVDESQDF